jgi:hypothetical protein
MQSCASAQLGACLWPAHVAGRMKQQQQQPAGLHGVWRLHAWLAHRWLPDPDAKSAAYANLVSQAIGNPFVVPHRDAFRSDVLLVRQSCSCSFYKWAGGSKLSNPTLLGVLSLASL